MMTDAVLYKGKEVPEGMLDLVMTGTCGLHDIIGYYMPFFRAKKS